MHLINLSAIDLIGWISITVAVEYLTAGAGSPYLVELFLPGRVSCPCTEQQRRRGSALSGSWRSSTAPGSGGCQKNHRAYSLVHAEEKTRALFLGYQRQNRISSQNKWEWKRRPAKARALKGGRRKKEESIGQWASILVVPPLLIL